jgi:hypothetical protein
MKPKTKLVNVLLTNIPIAICISAVAGYIALQQQVAMGNVPQEAFWPAFAQSLGMNFVMSYIISFCVGYFLPVPQWGMAFAGLFGVTPRDGLKFGLCMNFVINTVYVLFNSVILTYVNACVLGGAPIQAFVPAWLSSLGQCWIVGFIVSFLWAQKAEQIARNICNDPAPDMH